MDISYPKSLSRIWTALVVGFTLVSGFSNVVHAYNEPTHEWITRNALTYLRTHPHFNAETDAWIRSIGSNQGYMEEALVRAVVDGDYKNDMWLNGFFHKPFVGGQSGKLVNIFTTMFHHLNVTVKGDFWAYDGYSYRHSTRQGNDSYLNTPSATIWGSYSKSLGGSGAPGHADHGYALGTYNAGFRGTTAQWNKMFFYNNDASDAVFPPSNIPAQLAYNKLLTTDRAPANATESWNDTAPLVTGLFTTGYLSRHYWRGEVEGLPRGFDLLGLAIHLTQDLTVPQHAEGTADNCHPEYEDFVDELACNVNHPVDHVPYYNGSFGGITADCSHLYDPALVERIFDEHKSLDPRRPFSVAERMQGLAFISSQWQWGVPDDSVDPIGTILPDGNWFTGDHCSDILKRELIREQTKYQYNLGIAATVMLFEMAARDYEVTHPKPIFTRAFEILKSPFRLF